MRWAPARIGRRRESLEIPPLPRPGTGRTEIAGLRVNRKRIEKPSQTQQEFDPNAPHPMINLAEVVSRKESAKVEGIFRRGVYLPLAARIRGFELRFTERLFVQRASEIAMCFGSSGRSARLTCQGKLACTETLYPCFRTSGFESHPLRQIKTPPRAGALLFGGGGSLRRNCLLI